MDIFPFDDIEKRSAQAQQCRDSGHSIQHSAQGYQYMGLNLLGKHSTRAMIEHSSSNFDDGHDGNAQQTAQHKFYKAVVGWHLSGMFHRSWEEN